MQRVRLFEGSINHVVGAVDSSIPWHHIQYHPISVVGGLLLSSTQCDVSKQAVCFKSNYRC